jgi:two-component system CheB/CheR fusion protein
MLLEIEGHETTTVYTARDALERVRSVKPQVVLLDIGLPEIDGYEVARQIRKLPALDQACLIALTGYGQAEDRQRAQEAGFDDHLIKPADLAKLRSAISRHLGGT